MRRPFPNAIADVRWFEYVVSYPFAATPRPESIDSQEDFNNWLDHTGRRLPGELTRDEWLMAGAPGGQ